MPFWLSIVMVVIGIWIRLGILEIIATPLLASTGSGYAVATYIAVCAIVSATATSFLPDYTNRDISQEDAYGAAPQPTAEQPLRSPA